MYTAELFSKLCISQIFVHDLRRNWKNYAWIGDNNVSNLQVSEIHGTLKKLDNTNKKN